MGIKDGMMKIEGIEKLPAGVTIDAATKKSAPLVGEAIADLSKVAEGAPVGTNSWLHEAAEVANKANKGAMEKESIKIMRKVGGFGWSWGNLSGKGKAGVIAVALAGTGAGIMAANAIFGGKHSSAVSQSQQPEMATGAAR